MWNFTSLLPAGGLTPMAVSQPKTLTFQVAHLRPWKQGKDLDYGVLNLEARVLGNLVKKEFEP